MPCYIHADRDSVASCVSCGAAICRECDVPLGGKHYCKKCLAGARSTTAPQTEAGIKKLKRSMNDRYLAGVCGGAAKYLKMDSSLVRILYVVLTLCTAVALGIILYIVAAFVIPNEEGE